MYHVTINRFGSSEEDKRVHGDRTMYVVLDLSASGAARSGSLIWL